ncbi:kinesin protein KIN-14N [Trifolium repens]|nr:kinesin protein KIN-14N [Trifolium repens]
MPSSSFLQNALPSSSSLLSSSPTKSHHRRMPPTTTHHHHTIGKLSLSLSFSPSSLINPNPKFNFSDFDLACLKSSMKLNLWMSINSGEVEELSVKHRIVDDKIREELSKILDIKGSIRMFCRTRPNHLTEKRRNSEPVSAGSERIQIKLGGTRKDFEFDKVFPQETSQCANRCYMCLSDLLGLGGRWIFVSIVLI